MLEKMKVLLKKAYQKTVTQVVLVILMALFTWFFSGWVALESFSKYGWREDCGIYIKPVELTKEQKLRIVSWGVVSLFGIMYNHE